MQVRGESHSVREFMELAFRIVGLNYGKFVGIDKALYRPSEVNVLLGDASKARRTFAWTHRTGFSELVCERVMNDCRAYGVDQDLSSAGIESGG